MQRRDFLKLSGVALGAMLLQPGFFDRVGAAPIETQARGLRFRGSRGEILHSTDAGKTWQLHTRLGPDYEILDLFTDYAGRVYAQVGFQGFIFHLSLSENGKQWVTV
jgi:hypothetical protein